MTLLACKSGGTGGYVTESNGDPAQAGDILGEDHDCIFNETGKFALCHTVRKPADRNSIRFVVIDVEKDSLIWQETIPRGEVSWYNERTIKIVTLPGLVKEDQPAERIYYLDVIDQSKSETLKHND